MLKYEVHGTGAPLVLVHGITHRRQAWYPVLEHLTDHRTVVLFDLPGHGESHDLVVRDGVCKEPCVPSWSRCWTSWVWSARTSPEIRSADGSRWRPPQMIW